MWDEIPAMHRTHNQQDDSRHDPHQHFRIHKLPSELRLIKMIWQQAILGSRGGSL